MKTLAIAAAALGLACTAPALAAEADKMAMEIEFNDLDLATPKGQKTLDKRIERAARTVCRVDEIRTGTRIISQDARACLVKARADARQKVAALIENQNRGG